MDHTQELAKALAELKRITGVTMNVTAGSPGEAEQALTQIRCLCTAYKEKYNKTDFLQGLMTGGIPAYDIAERAARLHINPDEQRVLFLLEAKHIDETVGEILKSMFPPQTKKQNDHRHQTKEKGESYRWHITTNQTHLTPLFVWNARQLLIMTSWSMSPTAFSHKHPTKTAM